MGLFTACFATESTTWEDVEAVDIIQAKEFFHQRYPGVTALLIMEQTEGHISYPCSVCSRFDCSRNKLG